MTSTVGGQMCLGRALALVGDGAGVMRVRKRGVESGAKEGVEDKYRDILVVITISRYPRGCGTG